MLLGPVDLILLFGGDLHAEVVKIDVHVVDADLYLVPGMKYDQECRQRVGIHDLKGVGEIQPGHSREPFDHAKLLQVGSPEIPLVPDMTCRAVFDSDVRHKSSLSNLRKTPRI